MCSYRMQALGMTAVRTINAVGFTISAGGLLLVVLVPKQRLRQVLRWPQRPAQVNTVG